MIPNRSDYLQTEVMTATPQKLQLMLIEAAIRSASQARMHWANRQNDAACLALLRSQGILTELLVTLNPHSSDPLVSRVAATYLFVYRTLVKANLEHSQDHLDAALRVLEVERETWRQICEKLGSRSGDYATTGTASFVA